MHNETINCENECSISCPMEPRAKRQKVGVACDPCRTRKIKCDGVTPICQPCQKRAATDIRCTWLTGSARSSNVSSRQMTEPNVRPQDSSSDPIWLNNNRSDRVQEYANKRHANGDHIGMDQPHGGRSLQPPCNPNDLPLPYHNEHNTTHHRISNATPYSVNISPSDHSVHAIIGATASEDSVEGFFGSSSAGTFMQNVQKIVQQQVGRVEDPNQTFQPQDRVSITIPASGRAGVKSTSIDYVLPPRRRADFLLSLYWQYIHVLYPYLDKKQMDDDYKKLWNSGDSVVHEQSFVCLLNVIFALTCQIDTSTAVKERGKCADEFYRRARALLDIVDMGSVRSVQTFLLLGQYFQSTNEPHPCWVFTGLAIRTAQSLGLNLAETSERANDPQYRQHLRRVWYGCVLMDRVVSVRNSRSSPDKELILDLRQQ